VLVATSTSPTRSGADVASQVGSLIWKARTEGAAHETVTVRRHSLATILHLVEDGLLKHEDVNDLDLAELEAALADLYTPHPLAPHHDRGDRETRTSVSPIASARRSQNWPSRRFSGLAELNRMRTPARIFSHMRGTPNKAADPDERSRPHAA
jgi:hypothetical protein